EDERLGCAENAGLIDERGFEPRRLDAGALGRVGGRACIGRGECNLSYFARRDLRAAERGADRLGNVTRVAVRRAEAELGDLQEPLLVGPPEQREFLADGGGADELRDD